MDPCGDTTADSLRRGALTVKLNELQPVGEVASNPVQSHATYTYTRTSEPVFTGESADY